jgi:hypothetical protein
MEYLKIFEDGMHLVIRNILEDVSKHGVVDDSQLFITFLTKFPGVTLSKHMLHKYQDEITIILQHQFEQLVIKDNGFSVGLTFGGEFEIVEIPYNSILLFHNPNNNITLNFRYYPSLIHQINDTAQNPQEHHSKANIISLENFRKKHEQK